MRRETDEERERKGQVIYYPPRSKNAVLQCCKQHAHPMMIVATWKLPNNQGKEAHMLIGTLEGWKCRLYDPNGTNARYNTDDGACPVDRIASRYLRCDACKQIWKFERYDKDIYKPRLQDLITAGVTEGLCAIICTLVLVIRMVSGKSESVTDISDHIFDWWGEGSHGHTLYAWVARLAGLYRPSTQENLSQQNIITCLFKKPPGILWCLHCHRLISCVDLVFCHFCCATLFQNGGCMSRCRTEKTMRQPKRPLEWVNRTNLD